MKDSMHFSTEELNLHLDGRLDSNKARRMEEHIRDCGQCRRAWDELRRLDAAVRQLPLVETRPDFTRSVIDRLLIAPAPSLLFRLLEKASYVFGLFIVLGLMIAAFVLTGVFKGSEIEQTKSIANSIATSAGDGLAASLSAFTGWLTRYIPFAFNEGSLSVALFALVVLVMLAAIDRLVGRRVVSR